MFTDKHIAVEVKGKHSANISADTPIIWTNINDINPIFRIGTDFYQGVWTKLVGTELYFDGDGNFIDKSREKLILYPIKLTPKKRRQIMVEGDGGS